MRKPLTALLILVGLVALLAFAAPAFAYDEPHSQPETLPPSGSANHGYSNGHDCNFCHRADYVDPGTEDCLVCHGGTMYGTPTPVTGKGPHGVYSTVSDRCDACHDVHAAAGTKLLPGATVTSSCFACHDGTGGKGVYGAIFARTGVQPGQAHRIDTTSTVPGGDAGTGGSATMAFKGLNGNLGCDDCHSPHDSSTVASFTIERRRTMVMDDVARVGVKTSRLLRRNPGGSTATATVYGSSWCLACHKGRSSAGAVHNHPVETTYYFERLPVLASDTMTSATTTGTIAGTNRGYLMPYPRNAQQANHAPICQQCHEDSRFVGSLNTSGTAGDAATFTVTASDGTSSTNNPRFQTFPHETVNQHLLVETDDDLCLNCHPTPQLP